jgi:hypothetical protein
MGGSAELELPPPPPHSIKINGLIMMSKKLLTIFFM